MAHHSVIIAFISAIFSICGENEFWCIIAHYILNLDLEIISFLNHVTETYVEFLGCSHYVVNAIG